jgi:hypothetical protein
VGKIKKRLLDSLQQYHQKMAKKEQEAKANGRHAIHEEDDESDSDAESSCDEDETDMVKRGKKFNAAKYLFLSTRLARIFPDLKVAKIVNEFRTPWPKQSYQRSTDVTKNYNSKFKSVVKSVKMIAMFFITSFMTVPLSIQDMVVQMCTTAVTGYTILIHVDLYKIYPVLVVIPAIILIAILHFVVKSGQVNQKLEFARLFGGSSSATVKPAPVDDETALKEKLEVEKPVVAANNQQQGAIPSGRMSPAIASSAMSIANTESPVITGSKHLNRRQSLAHGLDIAKKARDAMGSQAADRHDERLVEQLLENVVEDAKEKDLRWHEKSGDSDEGKDSDFLSWSASLSNIDMSESQAPQISSQGQKFSLSSFSESVSVSDVVKKFDLSQVSSSLGKLQEELSDEGENLDFQALLNRYDTSK